MRVCGGGGGGVFRPKFQRREIAKHDLWLFFIMKWSVFLFSVALIGSAAAQLVPDSWDPRANATQSRCIAEILDQGHCGSCYAFAAASLLTDRLCFGRGFENSPAQNKTTVSPQPLISCTSSNNGCGGGWVDRSWFYYAKNPTPTCSRVCSAGA